MDKLKFYFVTWNVATRSPGQDLNSLLDFPSQYNTHKILADFYVIGLQEVKSQPQTMLMDTFFTDQWTLMFNRVLCRNGFVIAKSIRLQGIILLVYTQMKHLTHLREIEAQYTKTGLGGLWGNKGAVSVRFKLYGCSICIVNCHLTPHEHLLADRIADYNTIIKDHTYHISETSNILYHDYVFWIGDLNFRTDHPTGSSPTSEEIAASLEKIEKDSYASLLKHDQLLAVMESGDAFSEFTEPEINFPPTYKFVMSSDEYDLKRKPSWTDRILYKVIEDNYENVKLQADVLSYNHSPHYLVSDHKPVVAQFKIKVRQYFSRTVVADAVPKISRSSIRMRRAFVAPTNDNGEVDGNADGVHDIAASSSVACGCEDAASSSSVTDGDAVDGGTDSTVFSNYTESTVQFAPINTTWYIGDSVFTIQCTLSPDVEINPNDWIGVYEADFTNLDDYVAYEYLAKLCQPHSEIQADQARTITMNLAVGCGVRIPGSYKFIYFSQLNNDVRSVLGISGTFEVSYRDDRLINLNVPFTARVHPRHAANVFNDFRRLDVTQLTRNFAHDLSID